MKRLNSNIKLIGISLLALTVAVTLPATVVSAAQISNESNLMSNVGSVSKIYVTTAVLQLVDEGLVDLDEPVVKYLPEFKVNDERYKDITVRMLMNHSSGLMGSTWKNAMLYDDNNAVAHDTLLDYLSEQRLKADPGDYSVYCNDGFFLLELLVERVSGKDYTSYLNEKITAPLGISETGTPYNMFRDKNLMPVYNSKGERYAYEYCMDVGSGGIISSAPALAGFGSAFFKGDNTLISDELKDEMFTSSAKDEFDSPYGLGWDTVENKELNDLGVEVVGKGGDTGNMHSYLLVAPDEKISIGVNLSGGDSSILGAAMAEAVMEAIIEETKGTVAGDFHEETVMENEIPADKLAELREYEGVYSSNSDRPFSVEFKDGYLITTQLETKTPKTEYYRYTNAGGFAKLTGDPSENRQDKNRETFYFTKRGNGKCYIAKTYTYDFDNLAEISEKTYYAEKLEPLQISDEVLNKLRQYEGYYFMYDGTYSDTFINQGRAEMRVCEDIPGYVILDAGSICYIYMIEDATHLKAFVQIPGQNGRDLSDIEITNEDGMILGKQIDAAQTLICDKSIKEFDTSISQIDTQTDKAQWYKLSDKTKGATLYYERTENTSLYVFDKYGTMLYSNYMLDYPNEVPLPTEGYICFRGETGGHFDLSY